MNYKVYKLANHQRKLYYLLAAYLFVEYLRFHDVILPILGVIKVPLFITLAFLFIAFGNRKWLLKIKEVQLIILLVLQMAIMIPFSLNGYHAYTVTYEMIIVLISVLALISIITNEAIFVKYIQTWLFVAVLQSLWVIYHGGKGTGGVVGDENDVCSFLAMTIPIACYLSTICREKKWKIIYLFSFFILVVGVVATSSRGGFLAAMAAILGVFFWRKGFIKIVISAVFVSILSLVVLSVVVPQAYIDDMKTITDKDNGTRNHRLMHWSTAWEMFKDNPILGVGPGNYPWVSNDYFHLSDYYDPELRNRSGRQSHSLFFTLIPELGLFGIIIFLSCIYVSIVPLLKIIKDNKTCSQGDDGFMKMQFSKMLILSIAGFLTSGLFVSNLYYPFLWHLIALSVCFKRFNILSDDQSNNLVNYSEK